MRWLLLFSLVARVSWGAACCAGADPRSFLSMKDLQDAELGVSTLFRDVYGWYDESRELVEASKIQTLQLSVGGAKRVTQDLALFAIVPMVLQKQGEGRHSVSAVGFGDILFQGQLTLVRSFFDEELFPTVLLTTSLKVPSGRQENWQDGKLDPATGNGAWEPAISLALRKDFRAWQFALSGGYTWRLGGEGLRPGDRWELAQSVTKSFGRKFSFGVGAVEVWTDPQRIGNRLLADTAGFGVEGFASATYFFDAAMSVNGMFSSAIPLDGFGQSAQASRSAALSFRYSFY